MLLAEANDGRNSAPEKSTDLPHKDETVALLLSTRFGLSLLRARIVAELAAIGEGVER